MVLELPARSWLIKGVAIDKAHEIKAKSIKDIYLRIELFMNALMYLSTNTICKATQHSFDGNENNKKRKVKDLDSKF